jgi:hypothetical protein
VLTGGRLDVNGGSRAQISFLFDEMHFHHRGSPSEPTGGDGKAQSGSDG